MYFRDAAGADSPCGLSAAKLLKLACMFELFSLPDCAAEVLVRFEQALRDYEVPRLLDLLVPEMDGKRMTYEEYLASFSADPRRFFARP